MKILVTGGAGFIGGNFVHYMVENHPEDMIVNLDLLTYAGNLETCKPVEGKPNYKFVKGDKVEILSPDSVGESFIVEELYNEEGELIDGCPHPGMMCKVKIPFKVGKNTFIRKELIK